MSSEATGQRGEYWDLEWFVERLEGSIPESFRRGHPIELSRARMLVGVCWLLLGGDLLFICLVQFTQYGRSLGVLGGVCAGCFLGLLALARRRSSTRLPALLLCFVLWGANLFTTLHVDTLAMATHASATLLPVISVFLLGWRLGLGFSVLSCMTPILIYPLVSSGPSFGGLEWAMSLLADVFILLGWMVSAALERVLRTLHESEGELSSLIESTDDIVCSLDVEGRLVTANEAARQYCQRLFGKAIPRGGFIYSLLPPERQVRWKERMAQARAGHRLKEEMNLPARDGSLDMVMLELTISPVWGQRGEVVRLTVFGRDLTERKAAEVRLSELHRGLVEASRQAGMAEVATGVLHNVGNTLNSVNVSANLVAERLHGLRVSGLEKAVHLLREHEADPGTFLTADPRGRQLPAYLQALTTQLAQERESVLAEVRALCDGVEHIRTVVGMQQQYARFSGVVEQVSLPELIDGALRLQAASLGRLGIEVRREYADVPPVWVDRHKLLQILLNLLSNARHAMQESGRADKRLIIRMEQGEAGRLCISVTDNGVGIAPEHLSHLFTYGFTTKKDGHGFGLHTSALAAEELGGSLSCASAGRGQGATFILELPLRSEKDRGEEVGHRTAE
ncbi:ATP-binding protein [Archangium sp.]|uniref:ATP-binding protein n=1 Tax=Archangium sp. TaxID=1872627 RepID=UPI002D323158|nr:ATP-binding protein [Archangium sp.]HYO58221.1 ATP-binding protein [Archangium sp.]